MMSVEEKFEILTNIAEECLTKDELLKLLTNNPHPICYDGFEPSGRMHIAQGVMKTLNVNKMTNSGCKVKIWIADWFAQLNNKMDGDLNKIRTVGLYLIEIWKASGMNLDNVEFLWSSDEINKRADEYWPLVMDIERRTNIPRATRCCQIMGRNEKDDLTVAQLVYPCMQCADIFFLKADICQLGLDQRKVNVLAREYCNATKRENKPVILSHHMLPGLMKGQEKMSKSDSSTAIFMEDEEDEVNAKIKKAYCPEHVEGNPCLKYIKYLVFPWFNEFKVERNEANGGDKVFTNYDDLVADYSNKGLHPGDLKTALSKALNRILQPVRDHFKTDERAKALLEEVKTNVIGTLNMLGLAKRINARFLITSTSEVYGDPLEHPQKESYWGHVNPIGVRSCYDEGKRTAETLTMDYFRNKGVEVRIARIFNTYGPRMCLDDGRVISNFVSQAIRKRPMTVYGDGKQTRSFQYVSDLVNGLMALMEGEHIGPFNLGNPGEFTMLELAQVVKETIDPQARIEFRENTADDPQKRKPDISKAKKLLNWEPKITLREGLPRMASDFKSRIMKEEEGEIDK